jgi:hypothetical protein
MNFWKLQPAEEINSAIESLPVASLNPIFDAEGKQIEGFRATKVGDEVIDVPTDKYFLKQHSECFRPIINGLTVSGVSDFKFCAWATNKRAELAILVGDASDGVKFGFKATNSYDRSSSIRYGFTAKKKTSELQIVEREHILAWTYRQVCANGLVIKVPLKTCKYMDTETITKVKTLLTETRSIAHLGDQVDEKIQNIQFVTEAYLLLKNPIKLMIEDAQNVHLTGEDADKLVEKYVGHRRKQWILDQFNMEEQSLWGLTNAITYIASHDEGMKTPVREALIEKAGNLLTEELLPTPTVA